jgi:serine 3-dehydrogenase
MFITGATAGIGEATVRRFVSGGWKVIGTGRRRERLDALHDELGQAFLPIVSDMRDVDDLQRVVDQLPAAFADVDLLVNNAGLAPPMSVLQDADQDPLSNAIETNIEGLVALTRALLPTLVARKGAVINLSSVAATYPYKGGAVYAGTKAFVRQFSLGLRCDLHGSGVRVTSIEPGMIETEFTLVRNGGDREASEALYSDMNPMTGDDTASIIWWVANLPPHVNVNSLELMPTSQSWAGFAVHRNEG